MWQKIKSGFANFMAGRHGNDQLGVALVITGLALYLASSFIRVAAVSAVLSYLGLACYIYAVFRMFSRNNSARIRENEWYLNLGTSIKQFFTRVKNFRKYKYFKCPECRARLRLPRKVGEVNVTCAKCRHQFRQKA